MRVQVRKCRFTGKIFESKDLKKYAIHLRNLRIELAEKRRINRVRDSFNEWLDCEKRKIYRVEDIPDWFLINQRMIMDAVTSKNDRYARFNSGDKFTKLTFITPPKYKTSIRNTHVCPEGGVTNFMSTEDRPKGYPGWNADVSGSLVCSREICSYSASDALNIVGLKTGSGGGGNLDWRYGLSIFLADWPGLEANRIISILKGTE